MEMELSTTKSRKKRPRSQSTDDAGSPYDLVKVTWTASLPPVYIGRVRQGVEEILNACLLRHSPQLGGVPLGYFDIKLLESRGHIFGSAVDISYRVHSSILVFRTTPGLRVQGTISQVTSGHVTLLVCGAFQVTVDKDGIPPRYSFQQHGELWKTTSNTADVLKEGTDVLVEIVKVVPTKATFFMEGTMQGSGLGAVMPEDKTTPVLFLNGSAKKSRERRSSEMSSASDTSINRGIQAATAPKNEEMKKVKKDHKKKKNKKAKKKRLSSV